MKGTVAGQGEFPDVGLVGIPGFLVSFQFFHSIVFIPAVNGIVISLHVEMGSSSFRQSPGMLPRPRVVTSLRSVGSEGCGGTFPEIGMQS